MAAVSALDAAVPRGQRLPLKAEGEAGVKGRAAHAGLPAPTAHSGADAAGGQHLFWLTRIYSLFWVSFPRKWASFLLKLGDASFLQIHDLKSQERGCRGWGGGPAVLSTFPFAVHLCHVLSDQTVLVSACGCDLRRDNTEPQEDSWALDRE